MSYQVLARKWRPKNFKDMVGQEPILRMLANALEQQRLHHAYLLTGTRGVGKTTIARILAKCLNCEAGITSNPCGTCHACQAIDAGQFLDLFEIDAASRTRVEDTRDLLDNVPYPPTQGRYKVYLIDEVHMLSNHSFNALLKTLEEPPAHVKFLLATTDPKRLPITILSRCLQFHLKRILPEQIAKHLQHICETETIPHDTTALNKLAQAADGSLRDALSLLDQAIAYGQGTVSQQDVLAMLGSVAQDAILPLLEALAKKDSTALFQAVHALTEHAPDFQQVLEEMITLFHQLAMAQIMPDASPANEKMTALCQQFSPADVQLYYQIALLGRRDLSLSPNPQQGFEMTMLRLLAFQPGEAQLSVKPAVSTNMVKQEQKSPKKENTAQTAIPAATNSKNASLDAKNLPDWLSLLPKLGLSGMGYALASNCVLTKIEGNKVELTLSASHQPMLNQKLKERIADAIARQLGHPVQLDITITADPLNTPVKIEQKQHDQKLLAAKKTIAADPQVKKLVEMYDASVEVTLLS